MALSQARIKRFEGTLQKINETPELNVSEKQINPAYWNIFQRIMAVNRWTRRLAGRGAGAWYGVRNRRARQVAGAFYELVDAEHKEDVREMLKPEYRRLLPP